jgi:hypothetical protein
MMSAGQEDRPMSAIPTTPSQATREEVYAEAAHVPDTAEGKEAQQERFRSWRADPRFERFWPLLDRLLTEGSAKSSNEGVSGPPR